MLDVSCTDVGNPDIGEATIQLLSMRGQVLLTQKIHLLKGRVYSKLRLDSKWKDDLYLVKVIVNNKTYSAKLMKINP